MKDKLPLILLIALGFFGLTDRFLPHPVPEDFLTEGKALFSSPTSSQEYRSNWIPTLTGSWTFPPSWDSSFPLDHPASLAL